jgi:beta-galactosidase/beta-glucuronidase
MQTDIDHPRPDFARPEHWISLNGQWAFQPDPLDHGLTEAWYVPGKMDFEAAIQVPFAWETPASGVGLDWMPVGWYRLTIAAPTGWGDRHAVLHFGAVHYHCQAWLNGESLGEHVGGYLPFEFDLTPHLVDGKGELILRVEAPVDKRFIPHGKQRSLPPDDYNDCAFTPTSGIWQPVWLEGRPVTHIEQVVLRPSPGFDGIEARISLRGPGLDQATLRIVVGGETPRSIPVAGQPEIQVQLPIANPRRWEPADPYLYPVELELASPDGVDQVHSFTGLREFAVREGGFYLNGKRIYLRGALDQGFWPGSGYTAPDEAALRRDVELAHAAGYNLIRKHIKLEDPRWLYWADRLGLLVWEEPPCVGRYAPEALAAFEAQLAPMVARDGNHPSILLWGLYNEEWGFNWQLAENPQMPTDLARAYDRLAALDPSRPIIDNSGWWHVKTDVVDWHYYDEDMRGWCKVTAALAADPEAWFGHRLSDTRWYETQSWVPGYGQKNLPLMNGEYGGGSLHNQGWLFRWQTQDLRRHAAFNGYIYTEFYDVEHEKVGIYTAERKLKDLGCDPAALNAETVIIFDLVPESPEVDLVAGEGAFQVGLLVSHHGERAIRDQLASAWFCSFLCF